MPQKIDYLGHGIYCDQSRGKEAFFIEVEGREARFDTLAEARAAIDAYRLKAEGIV